MVIFERNPYWKYSTSFFGIKEYWIADPVLESIKVYSLVSGKYNRVAELSRENNDLLST
ncbi:MAG: Uma2 family endonuclease [Rhodothermaceae bacterium]|nr:Uma2 family endonuclease [Rhodothermaceae bacterium]